MCVCAALLVTVYGFPAIGEPRGGRVQTASAPRFARLTSLRRDARKGEETKGNMRAAVAVAVFTLAALAAGELAGHVSHLDKSGQVAA